MIDGILKSNYVIVSDLFERYDRRLNLDIEWPVFLE